VKIKIILSNAERSPRSDGHVQPVARIGTDMLLPGAGLLGLSAIQGQGAATEQEQKRHHAWPQVLACGRASGGRSSKFRLLVG
jgi:hypothetical protein